MLRPAIFLILFSWLLCNSMNMTAQQIQAKNEITVMGTVYSSSGEALIGVSVYLNGTTMGTVTDANGAYNITIPDTTLLLTYSMIGYELKRVPIKGSTVVNVTLEPDLVGISEIVVIGYGKQTKEDLTGSVTSINKKSFKNQPITSLEQIIQGRSAGVEVSNSSGAPGGDVKIRIRGANSIFGNNNPLVVIDGIVDADMNNITANDIESIELLKDASSTAIFGSRGANGVVLVTTKSGSSDEVRINVNTFYSVRTLPKKIDFLNASQFVELYNIYDSTMRYVPGFNFTPAFSDDEVAYFEENPGTDWQDELFRTATASNIELSVQGGDKNMNYYISGGYINEEGILINTDFKRYNINAKISARLSKKIKISTNIIASQKYGHNNLEVGSQYSPIGRLPQWVATEPVWDESGDFYNYSPDHGAVTGNPVGIQMTQNSYQTKKTFIPSGNITYQLLPDLEIKLSGAIDIGQTTNNYINNNELLEGPSGQSAAGSSSHSGKRGQYSVIATYTKKIGEHKIQATGIYEQSSYIEEGFYANAVNLNSYLYSYYNLSLSSSQTAGSYYYDEYLRSQAFRINYALHEKYYLTSTIRRDGSSKFNEDNRYGIFPSAALAWRLSEEEFISSLGVFHNLKLRASYGVTGSQAVGSYATLANFIQNSSVDYVEGGPFGSNLTGLGIGAPGNPYLKWESTGQTDIGLEMGFFQGRLNMEIDLYRKITSDLLLNYELPYYAGNATVIRNIGKISNKGIDIMMNGALINKSDFTWQMDANFSINRNLVLDLGEEEQIFPGSKYADASATLTIIKEGEPLGTFYGYKYLGVWKSEETDQAALFGNKPGDAKYEEVLLDSSINTSDLQIIGCAQPDFIYGFNNTFRYKKLTLNIFLQGVKGGQVFNGMAQKSAGLFGQSKAFTSPDIYNRWTLENENTDIPAFSGSSALYPGSSRWLQDGSYLRIKNLSLSYNLPPSLLRSLSISVLQIYCSAVNLYTFTKYTGYDPEVSTAGNTLGGGSQTDVDQNIDTGAYPNARSFTLGLKVTF